jgi:glutamine amidotransferase
MWMHNGNIGAWRYIKRRVCDSIGEEWFLGIQGGTDSEWAFALFLDTMERMGMDPSAVLPHGFGHAGLRKAMLRTIERLNEFIAAVPEKYRANKDFEPRSLLNFAVTDGESIIVTRYVSSKTDEAASLYFSSGTKWTKHGTEGNYKMERKDKCSDVVLVASEPLTFERDNWVTVPTNSVLTITKQTVMVHPILDQYYNASPSHSRSMMFAKSKGMVDGQAPQMAVTKSDPNATGPVAIAVN